MNKEQFSQEQQDVLNAILEMTSAFHQKDMGRVMASYEPNAVIVFEPKTPVADPQTSREMFQNFFMLEPHFTYSGHEVFVNNDIAVHFAPWLMIGKAPDGTDIQQKGLSVAVLRKQKDGKWLMIFDNPHGQYLLDQD